MPKVSQSDNGRGDRLSKKKRVSGRVVVLGIGNPLRGDDGVGPAVVGKLKPYSLNVDVIDGGTAPENYVGHLMKLRPDVVLLVDAVRMGTKPGTVRVLDLQDLAETGLATHNLSLRLWMKLLECDILLLAAEPKHTDFGEPMSVEMRRASDRIVGLLMALLNR